MKLFRFISSVTWLLFASSPMIAFGTVSSSNLKPAFVAPQVCLGSDSRSYIDTPNTKTSTTATTASLNYARSLEDFEQKIGVLFSSSSDDENADYGACCEKQPDGELICLGREAGCSKHKCQRQGC